MQLVKAVEMKKAFYNLFNLYAHELSKYNPWLGTQINEEGQYLAEHIEQLITESSEEAFCIKEDNRPIGLVVFSFSNNDENACCIEQLFLIETSRRKGIAEKLCSDFWAENDGVCILHVLKANLPAVTYWEKLISKCGYMYKKQDVNEQMVSYEIKLDRNVDS